MTTSKIKESLIDMIKDLKLSKKAAEEFLEDLEEIKPKDIKLDNEMETEPTEKKVLEKSKFKLEEPEEEPEEELEEEPEEEVKIETTEDAKKVLDEAKEDIQDVIENLDSLVNQAEEEVEKVSYKRISNKFASNVKNLSSAAYNAILEANSALKHWAFIKKRVKKDSVDEDEITHPELKQVANTLKQMTLLDKILAKAGYVKKSSLEREGTAVPPTGAKFTGDKWPEGKNPAEIELRHWQAGAKEFDKDKEKEDKMQNPASDPRLKDEGNPHDEKPFVNASYNPVGQYYDIYDSREGRAIRYTFANAPDHLGAKDEKGLRNFASKAYANLICEAVIEDGLEAVRKEVNGQYLNPTLSKEAANSNGVKKYYEDAYGDKEYASQLTKKRKVEKENIDYKPEKNSVTEGEEFGKAKDGTGKISSTREELLAKARRGVELARLAAAGGLIEWNKEAVKKYAKEIMSKSEETIEFTEKMLNELPLVNEAALKEATIPDADSGIVGNTLSGVRDPNAKSKTEGIDKSLESDAEITKSASFVPQVAISTPSSLQLSDMFTTVEKKLKNKGVDPSQVRLRVARYKKS